MRHFETEEQLQVEPQDTNWITHEASLRVPIVLPWKKENVPLGTCFQSRLVHGEPWLKDSAFILSDLYMIPKVLNSEYGSTSSFQSIQTTRRSETGEHLSLGFGMGTGLPFLCSASVKGTYDEDVQKNNDSDKSSIRASVRCATVELERNPRLCHEALVALKYGGGYQAFTDQFGDYFVWGYRLGGDTGQMISSSSFSTKKVESYGITATVEVLLIEGSKMWTKDFHSFSAGKSMRLLGYDTLSDRNWNMTAEEQGIFPLAEQAEGVIWESQSILERTLKLLEEKHMSDGDDLTAAQCEFLTSRGVVVELVLLPMSALKDVARWTTERNTI